MPRTPKILLVDDDPSILALIRTYLASGSYVIHTAATAELMLKAIDQDPPDLILLDVMLPDADGIDLAARVKQDERCRQIPIVMVTAVTSSSEKARALKAGADDLLTKPIDASELQARVRSLLKVRALSQERQENRRLRQTLAGLREHQRMVGDSPPLQAALQLVADYAKTDFAVLITGQSGTGKELFAAEIHRMSSRGDRLLLAQNCSAIPGTLLESELFGYRKGAFTGADKDKIGLFEDADGSTIFLDEIGDMPMNLQAHLLRFLQNHEFKPLGAKRVRKVNVRIIAATNKDLAGAIGEGRFREDLFYRLNVLPLHLPALKERPGDIVQLLDYFITRESAKLGKAPKTVAPEALAQLTAYPWNGNVRELENFVKYMLATIEKAEIGLADLPGTFFPRDPSASVAASPADPPERDAASTEPDPVVRPAQMARWSWQKMETTYLEALLAAHGGNVTRAARQAGLKRSTLNSRLKRVGLK